MRPILTNTIPRGILWDLYIRGYRKVEPVLRRYIIVNLWMITSSGSTKTQGRDRAEGVFGAADLLLFQADKY